MGLTQTFWELHETRQMVHEMFCLLQIHRRTIAKAWLPSAAGDNKKSASVSCCFITRCSKMTSSFWELWISTAQHRDLCHPTFPLIRLQRFSVGDMSALQAAQDPFTLKSCCYYTCRVSFAEISRAFPLNIRLGCFHRCAGYSGHINKYHIGYLLLNCTLLIVKWLPDDTQMSLSQE